MAKKLNRRDLMKILGAGSTISFIPNLGGFDLAQAQGRSQGKPKLRAVIRLQMYAGWDVVMGCNPPEQKRHIIGEDKGKPIWGVHWNLPSPVKVDRKGFNFKNDQNANVEQSKAMQKEITKEIGEEFFNNPDKSLRFVKNAIPGEDFGKTKPEFAPCSGEVGSSGGLFQELTGQESWSKTSPEHPELVFGPLMHQFFQTIGSDSTEAPKSYADYMTVINGIDTDKNVSHGTGSVLAATGYAPAAPDAVGNNEGKVFELEGTFNPAIESIFCQELLEDSRFSPTGIPNAFVPYLTFNYNSFKRGYAGTGPQVPMAQLFDVSSLAELIAKTKIISPVKFSAEAKDAVAEALAARGRDKKITKEPYKSLQEIINEGELTLAYDDAEKAAFGDMPNLLLNKADTFVADNIVPPIKFRTTDNSSTSMDFRGNNLLRHSLDGVVENSWQQNLATAALLVKEGRSRGVSISFGGHSGFLPDTHKHNDHVQTIYQGQFFDGVKRLMNYLKDNLDENQQPLIDSTLVIVTSDIVRGPVYFDSGVHGKSDYRNNSMILIGGGLNHNTQVSSSPKNLKKGRRIGYSFAGLKSGRIDYKTGKDTEHPKDSKDRDEQKIRFSNIYASLLECYGLDRTKYYKDIAVIETIAKNKPGYKS
jgi:hypothetical protein